MPFKTLQSIIPDVILCLNGDLPEAPILHHLLPIPIAAADGAALKLHKVEIIPQFIVGDLDSLVIERDYWNQQKGIIIEEISDQNTTDFEKTLDFVCRKGYQSVLILGLHGGDLDHTLNNWSILTRYGRRMNLAVYDTGKMALPVYESITLEAKEGDMISLIPQPSVCLTTIGLEWNLYKETLSLGVREGARNCATQEHITIDIHSGALLLFQKAVLPYMPKVSTTSFG